MCTYSCISAFPNDITVQNSFRINPTCGWLEINRAENPLCSFPFLIIVKHWVWLISLEGSINVFIVHSTALPTYGMCEHLFDRFFLRLTSIPHHAKPVVAVIVQQHLQSIRLRVVVNLFVSCICALSQPYELYKLFKLRAHKVDSWMLTQLATNFWTYVL